MLTLLKNANLILESEIRFGYLIVENAIIKEIGFGTNYPDAAYDKVVDLAGQYLAPGFV